MNITEALKLKRAVSFGIDIPLLNSLRPERKELPEVKSYLPGDSGFPNERAQKILLNLADQILVLTSRQE